MTPVQLTIDDAPTARASDPDTSHQAGARAKLTAGHGRRLALEALAAAHRADHVYPGGMTDFELAAVTGIQATSVGKRRLELQRAGLVAKTDLHRLSPSGSPSIVWAITPAGLAEATEVTA